MNHVYSIRGPQLGRLGPFPIDVAANFLLTGENAISAEIKEEGGSWAPLASSEAFADHFAQLHEEGASETLRGGRHQRSLGTLGVAPFLVELAAAKATGWLTVQAEAGIILLTLQDGAVINAQTSIIYRDFLLALHEDGRVTETAVDTAIDFAQREGVDISSALVETKSVTSTFLDEIRAEHAEFVFQQLLGWVEGICRFREGSVAGVTQRLTGPLPSLLRRGLPALDTARLRLPFEGEAVFVEPLEAAASLEGLEQRIHAGLKKRLALLTLLSGMDRAGVAVQDTFQALFYLLIVGAISVDVPAKRALLQFQRVLNSPDIRKTLGLPAGHISDQDSQAARRRLTAQLDAAVAELPEDDPDRLGQQRQVAVFDGMLATDDSRYVLQRAHEAGLDPFSPDIIFALEWRYLRAVMSGAVRNPSPTALSATAKRHQLLLPNSEQCAAVDFAAEAMSCADFEQVRPMIEARAASLAEQSAQSPLLGQCAVRALVAVEAYDAAQATLEALAANAPQLDLNALTELATPPKSNPALERLEGGLAAIYVYDFTGVGKAIGSAAREQLEALRERLADVEEPDEALCEEVDDAVAAIILNEVAVKTSWLRRRLPAGSVADDVLIKYARLLVDADPSGRFFDRAELLLVLACSTLQGDTMVMRDASRVRRAVHDVVHRHAPPVREEDRQTTAEFVTSCHQRLQGAQTLEDLIEAGFYLDLIGYKQTLRGALLDPSTLVGLVALDIAFEGRLLELGKAEGVSSAEILARRARVEEEAEKVFKDLYTAEFRPRFAHRVKAAPVKGKRQPDFISRRQKRGTSRAAVAVLGMTLVGLSLFTTNTYKTAHQTKLVTASKAVVDAFPSIVKKISISEGDPKLRTAVITVDPVKWSQAKRRQRRLYAKEIRDELVRRQIALGQIYDDTQLLLLIRGKKIVELNLGDR